MIACLTVPYFAAAVERRAQTALAQRPLVIGGRPWEAGPLFGFSHEAARQGVRPGMPLRQAHVLSPESSFLPAAPLRYTDADGELIDVLAGFTHLIAPEALWQPAESRKRLLPAGARTLPARYTVDLEALPSPEALSLLQEMGRTVRRHTHLEPAAGLAADPFTAQVAASLAPPNHLRPVEPGAERLFLAERSLDFLPLEREAARRLRLLGIRTLGQLTALSPAALREQFGTGILPFYRLARGEGSASVRPPSAPAQEQVTCRFDPPLVNWLEVQSVLAQIAAELARNLAEATLLGRTLCLLVEPEEGAPQHLSLPLRRPTADAGRLAQATQELAQTLALESGISALTVSLGDLQLAVVQQLSLFEQPAQPGAAEMLSQIMDRHPAAQFLQPVRVDGAHPLAERRFDWHPV